MIQLDVMKIKQRKISVNLAVSQYFRTNKRE